MRCPGCQAKNPEMARFCHRCGEQLVQPGFFRVLVGLLSGTGLTLIVLGVALLLFMSGILGKASPAPWTAGAPGLASDINLTPTLLVAWNKPTATPAPTLTSTPKQPTATYTPVLPSLPILSPNSEDAVPPLSTPIGVLQPPQSVPQEASVREGKTSQLNLGAGVNQGVTLLFWSNRDGSDNLHAMNLDGSSVALDLAGIPNPWDPSLSPDGTRVLFEDKRDIFAISVDGGQATNLTQQQGENRSPAWSPDGQHIAFWSTRSDPWGDIFVMKADGSQTRNLTQIPLADYHPCWSPTGDQIVFTSRRDGNDEIYSMNPDGSRLRNLTRHPARDFGCAWSPDGTKIAFTSERDGNWEIYLMDYDGSNQVNLSNNPSVDYAPAFRKVAK